MQKAMNHFLSEEFYNHVSEKTCDFFYNKNFDNIDASVDSLDNSRPILKVNCSQVNDKYKPRPTNEIKSLIR